MIKWIRSKLSRQIFLAVFLSIFLILTTLLVIQLFFLDDWFYNNKFNGLVENIENTVGEIKELVDEGRLTDNRLYRIIDEFEERNGAMVNVYDNGYTDIADEFFYATITLESKDNALHYAFFEYPIIPTEEMIESFYINNELWVEGYLYDDIIFPTVWVDVPVILEDYEDEIYVEFLENGVPVENDYVIREVDFEGIDAEGLEYEINALDMLDAPIELDNNFFYQTYEEPYSGATYVTFIREIDTGNDSLFLITDVSFQGLSEAIALSVPVYIGIYVIGFILALAIAFVLSRSYARPVKDMSEKTLSMCELNFDKRIDVNRVDEIGMLGNHINLLSEKLDTALGDLNNANQQLLRDIEKERLIEKQRRDFVANVSHELKTPIGIAKGYVEAIMDGIRSDQHDNYLRITVNELDRMNQIVLNMLELMKLDAGEQSLNIVRTAIKPFFDELGQYFELQLRQKHLTLNICDEIPAAMIDIRTFKMLILNLMSNAVKYGKEGTSIDVDKKVTNKHVTLYIENTVEEPEAIDLDQIWHKFYTADQSRNRLTSGTGLGLSIVKSILDQYGTPYNVYIHKDRFVFELTFPTSRT